MTQESMFFERNELVAALPPGDKFPLRRVVENILLKKNINSLVVHSVLIFLFFFLYLCAIGLYSYRKFILNDEYI